MYGFPKSDRGNITPKEKDDLKKLASALLRLSDEDLNQRVKDGDLREVASEE